MRTTPLIASLSLVALCWAAPSAANDGAEAYTRLRLVHPTIISAARAFPGGGYEAENILLSSGVNRDYASDHLAERTYVDFDFGCEQSTAAFRHVQRSTPDTIARAVLLFSQTADFEEPLAKVEIHHVDEPGAATFAAFQPVRARYVRWQVTSVLAGRSPNVGGRSIEFFAAAGVDSSPLGLEVDSHALPIITRETNGPSQPFKITLDSPYAESMQATVQIDEQPPIRTAIHYGSQTIRSSITAEEEARTAKLKIEIDGLHVVERTIDLPPARTLTVYLLPHSHTDIGYTAIQTDIEDKQVNNLLQGLEAARRTADYPEDARFVWNVEVLWAADLFLKRLPDASRDEFFAAVRDGQVALNGMYLNELTGLCRPEELTRLFRFATQLSEMTGVAIDSAMISDVPGYTWGTVTAMNQAGIRYFSVAPNYFDRIGTILVEWENRPFWWIGPDGETKVLVWIPFWGYAMSHRYGEMSPRLVEDFCEGLIARDYPYDIAYARWAGHGDNAVPDPKICDFVKDWNATHVSPHFVISSTSQAFRAFENRYGQELPRVRGDWTPYWEDGAGSSAAETAMNRASSERLAQAETLWAMLAPDHYPVERFEAAWNNILLYSEHTWGAYCSISRPASPFTLDQWNIKQSYATAGNLQSRQLLRQAAQVGSQVGSQEQAPTDGMYVDVFNTTSWARTEVVLLPAEISRGARSAFDEQGRSAPVQRLADRELAVLVEDLPPFSGRRYQLSDQPQNAGLDAVEIDGRVIDNGVVRVTLDEASGAISELRAADLDANFVKTTDSSGLNDYRYLIGDDLANVQTNGPVRIHVRERGPLVASLLVESDAPGCHKLLREVRLSAGSDCVELINTVDKQRLEADSYHAAEGKESVNIAFPFHVPDGVIRLDVPYGVMRPEIDQMASACKNWLTVGRWADVSNADFGVTWITQDAPLIQIGGLTATLLNSQTNPDVWRKTIEPSQELISWAMNNHWGTNYRAYQEGPVVFRYALRPHRGPADDASAARAAIGFSQPLIAVPGRGDPPVQTPLLKVSPASVLVTGMKPSDDGKAYIVRLLNYADTEVEARLTWESNKAGAIWISDTSERAGQRLPETVLIPARGSVTVRAACATPSRHAEG